MLRTGLLARSAFALWQGVRYAQMHHQHGSEAACDEPALRCASKVTPAFAAGRHAVAGLDGGRQDLGGQFAAMRGKSFSAPVAGQRRSGSISTGGRMRARRSPSIARAASRWRSPSSGTRPSTARCSSRARTMAERALRSRRPITASNESQRFEAIALRSGRDGVRGLARQAQPRSRAGGRQEVRRRGAVLCLLEGRRRDLFRGADGASTTPANAAASGWHLSAPGHPVVVFRNIFEGGVRDHAVITFADAATPGEIHRVSSDDWQIAACPHHGPSLAIAPNGHLSRDAGSPTARRARACSMPTRATAAKAFPRPCHWSSRTAIRRGLTCSQGRMDGDGLEGIRRREDHGQADDLRAMTARAGRRRRPIARRPTRPIIRLLVSDGRRPIFPG